MSQTPLPQNPTREQRLAAALKDVDFSKPLSVDLLYEEKFPAEVDQHTFRGAVSAAMKKAEEDAKKTK